MLVVRGLDVVAALAASSRWPSRCAACWSSGHLLIRYYAGSAASCPAYHSGLLVLPASRVVVASSDQPDRIDPVRTSPGDQDRSGRNRT